MTRSGRVPVATRLTVPRMINCGLRVRWRSGADNLGRANLELVESFRQLVEGVEGGFGFVVEGFGFGVLLAEAFDDVGWGFGQIRFVVQLLFG